MKLLKSDVFYAIILKKKQDERDAKQMKENKEYLDLRTKQNKEFDEKIKHFQELQSEATLRKKQNLEFVKVSGKEIKQLQKNCAKLAAILDGIDTERVRLFKLGYQALDQKIFQYVHKMLDVINQSEEDSERFC